MHTTSGNRSCTGSLRALISAQRRRCNRASAATRSRAGPNATPSNAAERNAPTRGRTGSPSSSSASNASPRRCPRATRRRTSESVGENTSGACGSTTSTTWCTESPAPTASRKRSTSSGVLCRRAPVRASCSDRCRTTGTSHAPTATAEPRTGPSPITDAVR